MKTLIDTTIWSEAFRRNFGSNDIRARLAELLKDDEALIIGAVRQEFLTGIREQSRFKKLRHYLSAIKDTQTKPEDYELAATYAYTCSTHGVQGSNTDFLLCAVAARLDTPIFTTDKDFDHYAKHLPITHFKP